MQGVGDDGEGTQDVFVRLQCDLLSLEVAFSSLPPRIFSAYAGSTSAPFIHSKQNCHPKVDLSFPVPSKDITTQPRLRVAPCIIQRKMDLLLSIYL